MRFFTALLVGLLGLAAWSVLDAQKPFKEWPAIEYENFRFPPTAPRPTNGFAHACAIPISSVIPTTWPPERV